MQHIECVEVTSVSSTSLDDPRVPHPSDPPSVSWVTSSPATVITTPTISAPTVVVVSQPPPPQDKPAPPSPTPPPPSPPPARSLFSLPRLPAWTTLSLLCGFCVLLVCGVAIYLSHVRYDDQQRGLATDLARERADRAAVAVRSHLDGHVNTLNTAATSLKLAGDGPFFHIMYSMVDVSRCPDTTVYFANGSSCTGFLKRGGGVVQCMQDGNVTREACLNSTDHNPCPDDVWSWYNTSSTAGLSVVYRADSVGDGEGSGYATLATPASSGTMRGKIGFDIPFSTLGELLPNVPYAVFMCDAQNNARRIAASLAFEAAVPNGAPCFSAFDEYEVDGDIVSFSRVAIGEVTWHVAASSRRTGKFDYLQTAILIAWCAGTCLAITFVSYRSLRFVPNLTRTVTFLNSTLSISDIGFIPVEVPHSLPADVVDLYSAVADLARSLYEIRSFIPDPQLLSITAKEGLGGVNDGEVEEADEPVARLSSGASGDVVVPFTPMTNPNNSNSQLNMRRPREDTGGSAQSAQSVHSGILPTASSVADMTVSHDENPLNYSSPRLRKKKVCPRPGMVTILHVAIANIPEVLGGDPATFDKVFTDFLDVCYEMVVLTKGVPYKIGAGSLWASYNTPTSVPMHHKQACLGALNIRHALTTTFRDCSIYPNVVSGVSSGMVVSGNVGTKHKVFCVLGMVPQRAGKLISLGVMHGASVIATDATYRHACQAFDSRPIDVVDWQGDRSRPSVVYEILKEADEHPNEEWMYQLHAMQERDPFNTYKQAFALLMDGNFAGAEVGFANHLRTYHGDKRARELYQWVSEAHRHPLVAPHPFPYVRLQLPEWEVSVGCLTVASTHPSLARRREVTPNPRQLSNSSASDM
eukprot:Sspe_Gene.104044::Locus_79920_Transcript_1_1_Confidence_1.000_Length_2759::g.104044::m.104044